MCHFLLVARSLNKIPGDCPCCDTAALSVRLRYSNFHLAAKPNSVGAAGAKPNPAGLIQWTLPVKSLASRVQEIIISEYGAKLWRSPDAPRRGWLAWEDSRCLAHASTSTFSASRFWMLRRCSGASSPKTSDSLSTLVGIKPTLPAPHKQAGRTCYGVFISSIVASRPS